MNPITIFAIDPALANVGWMVLRLDPTKKDVLGITPPSWTDKKMGLSTYHCFTKIDGGTVSTRKGEETVNQRLTRLCDHIHFLIAIHKPDILAIESQLEVGANRCTWGVGLQFGIYFPYFRTNRRSVRLIRCPKSDVGDTDTELSKEDFTYIDQIPLYGIAIKPSQLQSIAHEQKGTEGKVVIERYREVTNDKRDKISHHEADAYFIGVHAGRFWAVCLEGCWGQDTLTKKEIKVFQDPDKGMVSRKYESWWTNF